MERQLESSGMTCPYTLAAYQVHGASGSITLLDRLVLGETQLPWMPVFPRIEHHSRRVFVPRDGIGVTIFRLDNDRLVMETTLACPYHNRIDIISADTIYACDLFDNVKVFRDGKIILTLEKPDTVQKGPAGVAVLGNSILVRHDTNVMAIYRHGSPTPVRVLPSHEGTQGPNAISTDCQRHFLVHETYGNSVFVFDVSGNLRHTLNIGTSVSNAPVDCAVVNRQLWVGCSKGDIVIMS